MNDRPRELWRIGKWLVDPALGELSQQGVTTKLDPRAMRLLMFLAERPGQVVGMTELLGGIWGKSIVTPSSVYEAMAELRQALGDAADNPEYIVTLPRRGYRLIAAVENCSTLAECEPDEPKQDPPAESIDLPDTTRGFGPQRRAILTFGTIIAVVAGIAAVWLSLSSAPAPSAPTDKSIAVLPFLDLAENQDQVYFADGLAEQLLDVLATVPGLRVISRTSSFQFKNRNEDMRSIGSKLGAAYLVEGSVRREGQQIRVVAQLIRSSDGSHQWSGTFNREAADILQLETDLAASLGRALELSVESSSIANPVETDNPEANDQYLRGLKALDPHTRSGTADAVSHFEYALSLDPDFAAAQVSLAKTRYVQVTYGYLPGSTGIPLARESIAKAVLLNPRSAIAHAMLARISSLYDWDWAQAKLETEAALALAPRNSFALYAAGDLATVLGEFGRAEALFRASLASDPLNPETHLTLAILLYGMHRADEAETAIRRVIAISPDYTTAQVLLGNILTMQGREEAVTECQRVGSDADRFRCLAKARYALGQVKEAHAELDRALKVNNYNEAFFIAAVYAVFGDADRAFDLLERAYAQKEPYIEYIKSMPEFDRIRSDKRYGEFLARMRLPN